jgi:NAD(P)-dependent dehydrogenase (short-subunit alcohol dehydrogenase family)
MKEQENKKQSFPPQEQETPGYQDQMQPEPVTIRDSYKGSEKLKGKVALITGGDSGIGRSVAVHFAREGADVAIVYLEEEEDAKKTEAMVRKEGQMCILIKGNIQDRNFCKECVEKTFYHYGKLNILVNNAAEQHPTDDLQQIDLDLTESTFKTNILAMFYLSLPALEKMDSGDSIINTTSITAYQGREALIDYSSTKGAIVSFTRALSKNVAGKNIRVNAVAPGPIWTPLIPATFPADKVKNFGSDTPLGRAGQPAECGPAYVFLASEDASFITGQVIHINGGEAAGG